MNDGNAFRFFALGHVATEVHPNRLAVFFPSLLFGYLRTRRGGIGCETDLLDRSLKSQLKEADRQQSVYVLIIGEREMEAGALSLKHMKTGAQAPVTKERFAEDILKLRDDEKGKTG